jgi:uncharacterized protein YidB (DUF937 family)
VIVEILDNIAKQLLTDVNADGKVDVADAVSAIKTLLADTSGKLDFNGIISKLQNEGAELSEAVSSWLGDGKNSVLSSEAVSNLFDSEKLTKFAATLNIDLEAAKSGLANAIPNLIDQVSEGGHLREKFDEGVALIQEEVTEVAATATASADGLLAKIKQFLNSIR